MVVFNSTLQAVIPDAVRGRVFILLDVEWSVLRLHSLALGAVLVDAAGVRPLFWGGETLLAFARVLGPVLLGGYDFRRAATNSTSAVD